MRLLLDSHVALWWLADAAELGPRTRAAVRDADIVHFSAVTPWELGIKRALGKLDLPDSLIDALVTSGFEPLAISAAHGAAAAALPDAPDSPPPGCCPAPARNSQSSSVRMSA